MRNAFLIILSITLLTIGGCSKCYKCVNRCKTCSEQHNDTTLTITICSDKLGEDYYLEYLDSLQSPSLGWTCADAPSNKEENFCGSQTSNNIKLLTRKEQGMYCEPDK